MTKIMIALIAWALASSAAAANTPTAPTGTGIGQQLPQFTAQLTDLSGGKPKAVEFDSHKIKRPTVFIFVGTHCATTAGYTERMGQLERAYHPKGVDFVYLYPNREDTAEIQRAFHTEKKLGGTLIDDQGARLAKLLAARRTTEVFLVNKDGTIVFHGGIDDSRDGTAVTQRYLATALDETLAGKPVTTTASQVFA